MKMKKLFLIFIFCIICQMNAVFCDDIIVEVLQGKLSGQQYVAVGYNKTYYGFKGIPYAKPPVGSLRFKAPEAPDSWEGIRDASKYGDVCPEYNPVTKIYTPGSEDCLYLNVYTPDLSPSEPLPVIIFIGGYAFLFDAGGADLYGSDFINAKNVVLVTFNHRLDALGFLSLGTEDVPGNAGLKDQVAVLNWVHQNIKYFGGDPNKVTLLGHSSGAVSVVYHMTSPMSANLFNRGIVMSGVPSCDVIYSHKVEERSFLLAKELGINTKNVSELLYQLQNVPYEKLINHPVALLTSEEITNKIIFKKMASYVGTIEKDFGQKRFITESPMTAFKNGNVNKVDVMFSYSSQEAVLGLPLFLESVVEKYNRYPELFVPYMMAIRSSPDKVFELSTDIKNFYFGDKEVNNENINEFIRYSNFEKNLHVHRYIRHWPRPGKTYLFKFSAYSSRNMVGVQGVPYNIEGPAHGDILNYIFNPTALDLPLQEGSAEFMMVDDIVTALTDFAKTGNPSASLSSDWPQYDNECKNYAEFKDYIQVGIAPDEDELEFWDGLMDEHLNE